MMGYVIFEHVMSFTDALACLVLLHSILGKKSNHKIPAIVFLVVTYISAQYMSQFGTIQMFTLVCINYVYAHIYLKGKFYFKVLLSCVISLLFTLVSFVVLPLLSWTMGAPINEILAAGQASRILVVIVCKLALWIIVCIMIFMWSDMPILNKREQTLILLLMAVSIIILMEFVMVNYNYGFDGQEQTQLMLVSVLIIFVLMCCVYMIIQISKKNKELLNKEVLMVQWESQKQMVIEISERETRIKRQSHDLKHYVNIWRELASTEGNTRVKEEMDKYLHTELGKEVICNYIEGNDLINSVIYQKLSDCKKYDIDCDYECLTTFAEDKEMNVAVIMSNLLDNAIRAERELSEEKRFISFKLYSTNGVDNIIVENYIEESVLKRNPRLESTKEDNDNHGIGLNSVKYMAEKLEADVDIREENDRFIVYITGI